MHLTGVTPSPSFDFFPFPVALSSFKYSLNRALMERGGGGKMSILSASGLLVK